MEELGTNRVIDFRRKSDDQWIGSNPAGDAVELADTMTTGSVMSTALNALLFTGLFAASIASGASTRPVPQTACCTVKPLERRELLVIQGHGIERERRRFRPSCEARVGHSAASTSNSTRHRAHRFGVVTQAAPGAATHNMSEFIVLDMLSAGPRRLVMTRRRARDRIYEIALYDEPERLTGWSLMGAARPDSAGRLSAKLSYTSSERGRSDVVDAVQDTKQYTSFSQKRDGGTSYA